MNLDCPRAVYDEDRPRQLVKATVAVVALMLGTLGLPGCSGIHLMDLESPAPQTSAGTTATDVPGNVTGTVGTSVTLAYGASEPTDWEAIRKTVSSSLASPQTARIEWTNPVSGNSGTISGIRADNGQDGRPCRTFEATVAGVDGVHLFHAELCLSPVRTWEFSRIAAADSQ